MSSKRELLLDFLGEAVSVVTDATSDMLHETSEGLEPLSITYVAEGVLLDYDDDFLLLGDERNITPPELVNRNRVVSVKLTDKLESVLKDRPPIDELS